MYDNNPPLGTQADDCHKSDIDWFLNQNGDKCHRPYPKKQFVHFCGLGDSICHRLYKEMAQNSICLQLESLTCISNSCTP